MSKLRTIIRLYEDRVGLKTISVMVCISRNTVKKYIHKWNSLNMSYDELVKKSDAELHELFCVSSDPGAVNPRMEELMSLLPELSKELSKKGMTTLKLWQKYIGEHPGGYGITQFRIALQRYRMVSNPSMRMEHKAGDKMFIDYTGDKLWIYPHGEPPRQAEVF